MVSQEAAEGSCEEGIHPLGRKTSGDAKLARDEDSRRDSQPVPRPSNRPLRELDATRTATSRAQPNGSNEAIRKGASTGGERGGGGSEYTTPRHANQVHDSQPSPEVDIGHVEDQVVDQAVHDPPPALHLPPVRPLDESLHVVRGPPPESDGLLVVETLPRRCPEQTASGRTAKHEKSRRGRSEASVFRSSEATDKTPDRSERDHRGLLPIRWRIIARLGTQRALRNI